MKKPGIDIQLLLHNAVSLTAIQRFLSIVIFPATQKHSADHFPYEMKCASHAVFNKNKTQSFQLPK